MGLSGPAIGLIIVIILLVIAIVIAIIYAVLYYRNRGKTNTVTPPGQVTGVALTSPSAGTLNVTWTAVTGATSYNVFYAKSPSIPTTSTTTVKNSTTTSASITGLSTGQYIVIVTAVNSSGVSGPSSDIAPSGAIGSNGILVS
jgi:hypothetical protein